MEAYDLSEDYILTENQSADEKITSNNRKYRIIILPIWPWLLAKPSTDISVSDTDIKTIGV